MISRNCEEFKYPPNDAAEQGLRLPRSGRTARRLRTIITKHYLLYQKLPQAKNRYCNRRVVSKPLLEPRVRRPFLTVFE
jgi:hypothetical protein